MFAPEISSTGAYLEHLLRRHANYERLLVLISVIVPLIIPFIWYYPLVTLFDRRKTEVRVLEATGKKRRTIRGCFAVEGALVGASAFAAVLALCLPAMLIFKVLCFICKLPIEFSFGAIKMSTLLTAAAISASCALVSFGICYATTSTGRIKKKRK
jgi:ABC-type lipoprotein release transport system permease subunit